MGVYLRGNAVTLVERFYLVDPLTEVATLTDPTLVVFTLRGPDGDETTFIFGTDTEVTNPDVGVYLCALDPLLPTGDYTWAADGTGAVLAHGEGQFKILPSGVLDPDPPTIAQNGPCSPWITGTDVLACTGLPDGDAFKADTAAKIATDAMWSLSGRQFNGICEMTSRPCRRPCGCWPSGFLGLGPWYWGGGGVGLPGLYGYGGWWVNDCGDRCGCGPVGATVELAGYPVREILEVKISGDVVDPSHYRLDGRRDLVYLTDDDGRPRLWPACQVMELPDDAPGTFSVKYTWGAEPTTLGIEAAKQLACEIYKGLNGQDCKLPANVKRVVRQGITIEKMVPFAEAFREGNTGLMMVDLFIATENPHKMRRAPAIYSPDVEQFPREIGQR